MQSPHCHARVGGLCGFRSAAERVSTGSLKTGRCAYVQKHCRNSKHRKGGRIKDYGKVFVKKLHSAPTIPLPDGSPKGSLLPSSKKISEPI